MEQMLQEYLPPLNSNSDAEPTRKELEESAGRLLQKAIEVKAVMDMPGWKHVEQILVNAYEKNREFALEADDLSDKDREKCRQYALSAKDIRNHIYDILGNGVNAKKVLDEIGEDSAA